ncbi:SDR family NAD(P)-dependent oxidoreductase [Streptomyces sp. SCPE 10]|uniref:SDR family NAD(P)-dependent oxidoreductase n=1 Tax=Streptomyces TaxID=1883 RepID=UPI0033ABFF21
MRGRAGAGLTGPEGGVGHAIARALVRHGAAVAVLDRDAEAANRTVDAIVKDGGEAFRVDAEATRDEDCRRAVTVCARRFGGRLDVSWSTTWPPANAPASSRSARTTGTASWTSTSRAPG